MTNMAERSEDGTVPAWVVLFDCGHTRHPDACHCKGDDAGHAPHDGPPPPRWAGWCVECGDFRTTVECIEADPLDGGHTVAMRQAAQVIAAGFKDNPVTIIKERIEDPAIWDPGRFGMTSGEEGASNG